MQIQESGGKTKTKRIALKEFEMSVNSGPKLGHCLRTTEMKLRVGEVSRASKEV